MNHTNQHSSAIRLHQRAFSLIEMMVAVSLLLVIIIGLFAMFSQAQRALKAGTTQVDIMEPGRATMELIARDLQELMACKITNVVNFHTANTTSANPLRQTLPGPGSRVTERVNELDEVFFLTLFNDRWNGVGYRVDGTNDAMGTLYRFVTNAPIAAVGNLPRSFFTNSIHQLNGLVNPQFHRVLDGVVHFKAVPYRSNGELYLPRDYDVLGDPQNILIANDRRFYTFLNDWLPAYVEVELGVLEPGAREQFKVQPPALRRKFLENKAAQVHLFRQRIPIRTAQ